MKKEQWQGRWLQLKGRVRAKWGGLTDEDLDEVDGDAEVLLRKLQERYEIAREEAERRVEDWLQEQGRSVDA
ncbi:MAG: CsbD family protein [Planctomycetes bacterium]|nr:CsbD family protein [Planctomycetota bacterium]